MSSIKDFDWATTWKGNYIHAVYKSRKSHTICGVKTVNYGNGIDINDELLCKKCANIMYKMIEKVNIK